MDEKSREITTFITPMGLFCYKRLLFGVISAPEIFQTRLEHLLDASTNVLNNIDDIRIFEKTDKPFESIFELSSKPPARIARKLIRLQEFKFKVKYRMGKEIIAVTLSRLCELSPRYCYDMKGEHIILRVVESATPLALSTIKIAEKCIRDEEIVDAMSAERIVEGVIFK